MHSSDDQPAAHEPTANSHDSGETIARWSDGPAGLSLNECARRGVEAVAGLVIGRDVFGTNNYPDAHFCACAEMRHVVTGGGPNIDDHISVSFRVVEIKNGTYPMVGEESARMIMQPLSDGNVSARWHPAGAAGRSQHDFGPLAADLESRSAICGPMTLGDIPEQDAGDSSQPSFLFLKDPGAGWQIWRRFTTAASEGQSVAGGSSRVETYTMIYPMLSPHMNWRFRVYDLPGGGLRWEVDSGNRK